MRVRSFFGVFGGRASQQEGVRSDPCNSQGKRGGCLKTAMCSLKFRVCWVDGTVHLRMQIDVLSLLGRRPAFVASVRAFQATIRQQFA